MSFQQLPGTLVREFIKQIGAAEAPTAAPLVVALQNNEISEPLMHELSDALIASLRQPHAQEPTVGVAGALANAMLDANVALKAVLKLLAALLRNGHIGKAMQHVSAACNAIEVAASSQDDGDLKLARMLARVLSWADTPAVAVDYALVALLRLATRDTRGVRSHDKTSLAIAHALVELAGRGALRVSNDDTRARLRVVLNDGLSSTVVMTHELDPRWQQARAIAQGAPTLMPASASPAKRPHSP